MKVRDHLAGVERIGSKGMKFIHTFSEDKQESRRLKVGFFMGAARLKATTMYSFKGWETRALVLYTGHVADKKAMTLIYAGLTRLKRHMEGSFLTVVSSIPKLAEYGKTWPEFAEV